LVKWRVRHNVIGLSSNTSGEGDIRQKIIENDLVDCMIALPGQLFYTTQIPVCLWFISKDKKGNDEKGLLKRRSRQGETLFIDAREMGTMVNRTLKELTNDDIAKITATYHIWRGEELAETQLVGSLCLTQSLGSSVCKVFG
jgi:type I restriction enzyme M protein